MTMQPIGWGTTTLKVPPASPEDRIRDLVRSYGDERHDAAIAQCLERLRQCNAPNHTIEQVEKLLTTVKG